MKARVLSRGTTSRRSSGLLWSTHTSFSFLRVPACRRKKTPVPYDILPPARRPRVARRPRSVSGEGSRWNQILRLVRDGKIKRNDEPLVKVHDVRFMIKRDGKDQPARLIAHLRWPSCPRCSCSIPTSPCRGTCAFSCLKQPPNFHVWIVKCRD